MARACQRSPRLLARLHSITPAQAKAVGVEVRTLSRSVGPGPRTCSGCGEAFTGVLDWTTARVDDPARDLAAQYGAAGQEMLDASIPAYEQAGGHLHPGLAVQARHLWDASAIGYASTRSPPVARPSSRRRSRCSTPRTRLTRQSAGR